MDSHLRILIDVQALDTRIFVIEAEVARLPGAISSVRSALEEARAAAASVKTQLDTVKKDTRAKEKDLDVAQAKRAKIEARLYEVKTNREYSAALIEIEDVKQEKSRIEEEILTLMERQERLAVDIREAEARLTEQEREGRREEAALQEKLRLLETDLAGLRSERGQLTRELPALLLANYERLLKARGGLALAQVIKPNHCAGCRMTVTPQRVQELRQQNALITCESCGRYLYWVP